MPCEQEVNKLDWKNIKDDVWTSQFTSTSSGQKIYLKKILAKKKSKNPKTFFLFHDLTSYHGRFHHLTSWFQNNYPEVSFILMDFVGHGLSNGTRVHIQEMNWLTLDMLTVFESLTKNNDEQWIVLGHGMGALAILDLMSRSGLDINRRIDRIIISNFTFNFTSTAFKLEHEISSRLNLNSSFVKQSRPMKIFDPQEMLSSISEQVKYLNDPLIVRSPTFQSLDLINKRVKSIFLESYFLDKPTLILTSRCHHLIAGGMEAFSKGFKKGILSKKSYSNFKHDLYNEKESETVFKDISEWISL